MSNIINIAENNKKLTNWWLIQSVSALALSGFFAIFLVIGRSPKVSELLPYKDFFKTSLTIHVNLSVLIWLTSFICTVFASKTKFIKLGFASLFVCLSGTAIVALSIFDTTTSAYLNNYIPMLDSKIFQLGIWIYFAGFFFASFQAIASKADYAFLRYFNISSFFIIMAAFLTLLITYYKLNLPENIILYSFADHYEKLFWGFGHILQFLYTNAIMMAWFWFAIEFSSKQQSKLQSKFKDGCFLINLTLALTGIYIVVNFDVSSYEYTAYYTKQMIMFGGAAASFALLIAAYSLIKNFNEIVSKPIKNAFIWSIILFVAGGIISMFIKGSNTIIPAHYHGSIIGISLSLMGLCYLFMPKLGYGEIKGKMANIQPVLYGFGQLLHIIGFAISGGYGAMRKAPGEVLSSQAKAYMALMGIGGLISIIGGLFFVIIIFRIILKRRS